MTVAGLYSTVAAVKGALLVLSFIYPNTTFNAILVSCAWTMQRFVLSFTMLPAEHESCACCVSKLVVRNHKA